jgi:hypothetical protein
MKLSHLQYLLLVISGMNLGMAILMGGWMLLNIAPYIFIIGITIMRIENQIKFEKRNDTLQPQRQKQ